MDGFLFLDKPVGITSFGLIRKVKKRFRIKRVGHAGTLDKLASGLMIIALGQATKMLEYLVCKDKRYSCVARLGMISETYDAEGPLIVFNNAGIAIDEHKIYSAIESFFLGEIEQIPPQYSALKICGKRASDLARAGQEISLKSRKVRIDDFQLELLDFPEAYFKILCSKGTYVRSLIHDLGMVLGCGAFVKSLRREAIGDFELREIGWQVKSLEDVFVRLPYVELTGELWNALSHGKKISERFLFLPEREMPVFYGGKLRGVLEKKNDMIKFKKMIV